MNFQPTSALLEVAGMASAHDHSQPAAGVWSTGAGAYPFFPFTALSSASSRPAATVASYHMATLPFLYSGWSTIALPTEPSEFADHHVPPMVFNTVVNDAPRSPHPGFPRRQMPAMAGVLTFFAMSATSVHVGFGGIVTPASFRTSLRYMRNDDSP